MNNSFKVISLHLGDAVASISKIINRKKISCNKSESSRIHWNRAAVRWLLESLQQAENLELLIVITLIKLALIAEFVTQVTSKGELCNILQTNLDYSRTLFKLMVHQSYLVFAYRWNAFLLNTLSSAT